MQKQTVDDTEYRGVRPDTKSKRKHCAAGEARALAKRSERLTQIVSKGHELKPRTPVPIA
jgi:hypothetical protein